MSMASVKSVSTYSASWCSGSNSDGKNNDNGNNDAASCATGHTANYSSTFTGSTAATAKNGKAADSTYSQKLTRRASSANSQGGFKYTYHGLSGGSSAKNQRQDAERLSSAKSGRVPNSKQVLPKSVKENQGITISYQWAAGGQTCHGFMWWIIAVSRASIDQEQPH